MWNLCRYTILETFIKDTCFDTRNISDIITKFLSEQTLNFPFWMFFCKKTKNHMPHAYNGKILNQKMFARGMLPRQFIGIFFS